MGSRDVRQRLAGLHFGGEFQAVVEALSILTQDAGDENRRKLFYENAMRLSTGIEDLLIAECQYSRMIFGESIRARG